MKRSWAIWLVFAGCLSVAFAAMSWISLTVVRLDEAEAKARYRALLEFGPVAHGFGLGAPRGPGEC